MTLAQFPAELLSEQRLNIRLIIDNQDPRRHGASPSTTWRRRALRFLAMLPPGWPRSLTCRVPTVPDAKPSQGLAPNPGTSMAAWMTAQVPKGVAAPHRRPLIAYYQM